jgi:hypothetical protein
LIVGGLYKDGNDSKGRHKARDERRLLLSWAKAGKDSKGSREATRSEGVKLLSWAITLSRFFRNGGAASCTSVTKSTSKKFLLNRMRVLALLFAVGPNKCVSV